MKSNVPVVEAINDEVGLLERVQEALGELLGAAKEGLMALSAEVGLGVLHELLELEVDEVVGPRGKWNRERTAVRHGHEDGEVTLGGRHVLVRHPRVRTADGEGEVTLQTYGHCARLTQTAASTKNEEPVIAGFQLTPTAPVDDLGKFRGRP